MVRPLENSINTLKLAYGLNMLVQIANERLKDGMCVYILSAKANDICTGIYEIQISEKSPSEVIKPRAQTKKALLAYLRFQTSKDCSLTDEGLTCNYTIISYQKSFYFTQLRYVAS